MGRGASLRGRWSLVLSPRRVRRRPPAGVEAVFKHVTRHVNRAWLLEASRDELVGAAALAPVDVRAHALKVRAGARECAAVELPVAQPPALVGLVPALVRHGTEILEPVIEAQDLRVVVTLRRAAEDAQPSQLGHLGRGNLLPGQGEASKDMGGGGAGIRCSSSCRRCTRRRRRRVANIRVP